MKKFLPLFLALLLLTACSRAPAAPAPEERPAPTEAPAVNTENLTPDEPENSEEDDPMKATTADESREPVAMSGETVTLDGLDSYLRLTLPEGWDWTEGETVEDRSSLILTPRTNDGFRVELVWWASFGMCGTGVDFSEYTLPDGRTATLAVDKSGDQVWWTLILPDSPDQFTIQFGAPQSVIDAHQAEIDAMLESLQLGALSHIPPQPQPPRDSI